MLIMVEAKRLHAAGCWSTSVAGIQKRLREAHLIKPQLYYNRLKFPLEALTAGSGQENSLCLWRFLIDVHL
jgi:hypothetical protein